MKKPKSTYPETRHLRLVIQEDEREAKYERPPEHKQPGDEPHKRAQGCEVGEGLCAEEAWERILLEGFEDVDFLRVEEVGDEWGGVRAGRDGEVGQTQRGARSGQ